MIHARTAIRRALVALAGTASLGLLATPAWSTCSTSAGQALHAFEADDGVVHAKGTHLEWQRCSVGQKFDDGKCHGTVEQLDWVGAHAAASKAGRGWRLPTQTELQGLVVGNCSAPATDTKVFPETPESWYWSSSSDGALGAWFVDFAAAGGSGATLRTNLAAVRLVRDAGRDR